MYMLACLTPGRHSHLVFLMASELFSCRLKQSKCGTEANFPAALLRTGESVSISLKALEAVSESHPEATPKLQRCLVSSLQHGTI